MTDVRALLLTDLVDSTAVSALLGDQAAAKLWAAHDRVARDLLRDWRGREIDKSDGLLLLFESTRDAAGYAAAYHEALARLEIPLRARAGLHVGPVVLRQNSAADVALGAKPLEVDGLAKPIAARVMALALAGQTLMTLEAREALGEPALRVQSHGHWAMKGLPEPVEIFEIGGDDSPFRPPPDGEKSHRVVRQGDLWLPVRAVKHSLPAERDAFVGRREALADLSHRFESGARLVSIIGIGGSGKTRFVTRFAWSCLGEFPGGAWFCDLAQARGLDGILHAVATALEVPLGKEDAITQLGNALAARGRCLVILDNFEQVSRHASESLGVWLNRASAARFVVTTREVLGLAGEQVLALPPLNADDARVLFVRRCEAAQQDFRLAHEDEAAAVELVKLLDGLPLAIELAAARVRVMPPRTLLARMGERFKLLSSQGQRADRQATLRATLDWSWDLLSPSDKAALAQLSVFEGGFALEAAEAVLDLAPWDAHAWAIDAVQSLADKSFVRKISDDRFHLLVSTQEYAAEHLRTEGRFPRSGPRTLAATQARHFAYFAELGEERLATHVLPDVDNLVAACRRAVQHEASAYVAGSLEGAWTALELRGPFSAGVELALAALDVHSLEPSARARVERIAASVFHAAGKLDDAAAYVHASLARARAIGDKRREAEALYTLAVLHKSKGELDEARAFFETTLRLLAQNPDPTLESRSRNELGAIAEAQGHAEQAQQHFEMAATMARALGDRRREGRIIANMGVLLLEQGRVEEGRIHYEQALAMAREVGDRQWEGNMLCNLGLLHQLEGKPAQASLELEQALEVARELGNPRLECLALCNLGIVCESLVQLAEAEIRYRQALGIARNMHDRRSEGQVLGYLALVHAKRSEFEAARECIMLGDALLRTMSDRFSLGILKSSAAETEYLAGNTAAGDAALEAAQSLLKELGAGPRSELGLGIERARHLRARVHKES